MTDDHGIISVVFELLVQSAVPDRNSELEFMEKALNMYQTYQPARFQRALSSVASQPGREYFLYKM